LVEQWIEDPRVTSSNLVLGIPNHSYNFNSVCFNGYFLIVNEKQLEGLTVGFCLVVMISFKQETF